MSWESEHASLGWGKTLKRLGAALTCVAIVVLLVWAGTLLPPPVPGNGPMADAAVRQLKAQRAAERARASAHYAVYSATHDHEPERSGSWRTVRKHHLELEPACRICGSTEDLEVHHVISFHTHPELELVDDNLITLCGPGGHNCHFNFGHVFNYKRNNEHIKDDAATFRKRIAEASAAMNANP